MLGLGSKLVVNYRVMVQLMAKKFRKLGRPPTAKKRATKASTPLPSPSYRKRRPPDKAPLKEQSSINLAHRALTGDTQSGEPEPDANGYSYANSATAAASATTLSEVKSSPIGLPPIVGRRREPARPRRGLPRLHALSFEDVEYIHWALVKDFADSPDPIEPPGVRDPNLLHSAVGRQTSGYGGRSKYRTIEGLAASLFYGICQNHAFHNGNKRTALVALLCYLDRNGYQLATNERELYDVVLRLASHTLITDGNGSKSDAEVLWIQKWIEPRIRQISKGEQPVRFQDLRSILVAFSCTLGTPSKGFITIRREADGHRFRIKLPYHGDTKEVDPGYVSKVRRALRIDEEHGCDSEAFYRAALRPDEFISKYRVLLRRLAHV
jgi:death-on-curing protein